MATCNKTLGIRINKIEVTLNKTPTDRAFRKKIVIGFIFLIFKIELIYEFLEKKLFL